MQLLSNFLRNYGQLFGKSRATCGKPYVCACVCVCGGGGGVLREGGLLQNPTAKVERGLLDRGV